MVTRVVILVTMSEHPLTLRIVQSSSLLKTTRLLHSSLPLLEPSLTSERLLPRKSALLKPVVARKSSFLLVDFPTDSALVMGTDSGLGVGGVLDPGAGDAVRSARGETCRRVGRCGFVLVAEESHFETNLTCE